MKKTITFAIAALLSASASAQVRLSELSGKYHLQADYEYWEPRFADEVYAHNDFVFNLEEQDDGTFCLYSFFYNGMDASFVPLGYSATAQYSPAEQLLYVYPTPWMWDEYMQQFMDPANHDPMLYFAVQRDADGTIQLASTPNSLGFYHLTLYQGTSQFLYSVDYPGVVRATKLNTYDTQSEATLPGDYTLTYYDEAGSQHSTAFNIHTGTDGLYMSGMFGDTAERPIFVERDGKGFYTPFTHDISSSGYYVNYFGTNVGDCRVSFSFDKDGRLVSDNTFSYSPDFVHWTDAFNAVAEKGSGSGTGGGDVSDDSNYVMECVDYGFDAVRRNVTVRFEGNALYVQGFSAEIPDAWAHATLSGDVATFETQSLGIIPRSTQEQYLTGADTRTGDVCVLTMHYDAATRSLSSTSNVWALLTSTPSQVGAAYDHLYHSITILPASQAGEDPNVVPPAGLVAEDYQLKGTNPYTGIPTDYTLRLGFAGSDVYVQGLCPAFPDAWVKGSVNGKSVAFKTPQLMGNYRGLYNMYVAGVDPINEELTPLVMDYDTDTRTLTSTENCWFIVQAGESNVLPVMLLDQIVIAPYVAPVPDPTPVVVPGGQDNKMLAYNFNAINADDNTTVSHPVKLLLDGKEVYVQGLSTYFPEAWVHGTLNGTIAVFPRNQYAGNMLNNDIWFGAGDAMSGELLYGDLVLTFNPTNGEFTQPESNYLAVNASTTSVYHLELYKSVRLTPSTEGIGTVLADDSTDNDLFDLAGRRATTTHRGIYLSSGRKIRM